MSVLEIRNIFDNSQHLHKQQKCLKQMHELFTKFSTSDDRLSAFKAELRSNILFTLNCEPKSPFTKHSIEFVAKFLRSFSAEPTPDTQTSVEGVGDVGTEDADQTIIDENYALNRSDQENREPAEDEDVDDELGMESFGSESFSRRKSTASLDMTSKEPPLEPTFADIVIKEQLIRFLFNTKVDIRYNCCVLIKKLFTDLEDMDVEVYEKLKKSLLERLRDKDKSIRSVAAQALHRFQEVDQEVDVVRDALKFHLQSDPDYRVRQSCLQSLHPTYITMDEFIASTRDVKDIIRKTAFVLIAEKFEIKNFGIEKRLQILKNGLNERHAVIHKVVETKLLPNWVKSYDGDLAALLYGLDIQSDPELIERMLFLYFKHINNDLNESTGRTGFHKFLDEFRDKYLETYNLLTKVELTVENAFLWRAVAQYCKQHDITVSIVSDDPNPANSEEMVDSDSQPNQRVEEKVDAIDTIVPDLPHYCRYINVFVKQLLANEYEIHELMEFEFMFNQLLLLGELLDIGDEAQRQILRQCLVGLLNNEQLFEKIHNYIRHLMKIFAQNTDQKLFLESVVDIIDCINSEAMDVDVDGQTGTAVSSQDSQPAPVETNTKDISERLRQFEIDFAKLSVRIESLKDDLEAAEHNDNPSEANRIKALIEVLTAQTNDVMEKRLQINASQLAVNPSSQTASQLSQNQNKTQKTLTDEPIALERCLQIFSGCLEFGDFSGVNAVLLTLIDRLVSPSIPNPDIKLRSLSLQTLGLSCLIAPELAKKYFALFIQVLNYDAEEAQECALKCIFDILCVHGLTYFEQKTKEKKSLNQSKRLNKTGSEELDIEDNKENRSNNSADGEDSIEDNERTIIDTDCDVLCSDSEQHSSDEEEEGEGFISLFVDLLERHLGSESENIKLITAKGIAKLFILGRMYSPPLLSKLVILWYDTESCEELRQFLGVFLPIYSTIEMKANLKGENAFEECFIKCVETVHSEALSYVDLDNMINFIIELMSDDGHKNLAKSVANQILTRMGSYGRDDQLSNKYYLKVLSILRLSEMSNHDIKEYKLLVQKIERIVNKSKVKTKVTVNRLKTIKSKIDKQIELIKHNSSQVTIIEDFGSLSMSQSLSQSLSDRSHIDETVLDIDPHNLSNG